jgi:16S rRNA (guanine966-N2)-methyltransferase
VRIIGGEFRGRPLAAPRSNAIRPTTDRVREALFNILTSRYPGLVQGVRVLDLFAGTGALGFEALSRGAAACVFVEQSVEGRGLIRSTIENLALQGKARILRRDATALGDVGTIRPFGLVFADPPYGKALGEIALRSARGGGWLEPNAVAVVEEIASVPFSPGPGFQIAEQRRYGDTIIRILRID